MSSRKKICVAITARPSYSRIKAALNFLRANPAVELNVLCSGSALLDRYGRVVELIRSDGFDVLEELYTFVEGNEPINMALTVSSTISQTATALRRYSPDAVVTIADRYETLGTAISVAYLNIPLIHIQGGEVSGNIDERVRHSITKLADFHLVANARAGQRLRSMGESPDSIIVSGCPSIDIARAAVDLPLSEVESALGRVGVGADVDLSRDFIVVLQHPDTNSYAESHRQMRHTLEAISRVGVPTILFWPNVDAGSDATSKCIREYRELGKIPFVRFVKNLEGLRFLRLLLASKCLVGNSSAGLRESAFLGVPVVNIGDRQFGRDRAVNVVDVPHDESAIRFALVHQLSAGKYPSSHLYGDGNAGECIANAIAGYTRENTGKTFCDD